MLADVKKQAKKENKNRIFQEATKAHELMYNLAKHINVYTEDYNHILMLTELKDEMDRFKTRGKYKGHFKTDEIIFFLLKELMNLSTNIEDSFLKFLILKSKRKEKNLNHFICIFSRVI